MEKCKLPLLFWRSWKLFPFFFFCQGCNKVIWILAGVAVTVTMITILAVFYSKSDGTKRPFTLGDYFNNTFRKKSYNLYWISDKEYLHKTTDGNIFLYNAETMKETLFLSNSTFDKVGATGYLLSGDRKYIALESNYTKVRSLSWMIYVDTQYPETVAVPYPKAGSNLTKVKLFVVNVTNPSSSMQVAPPTSIASSDHMLCSVTWVTDERIAVQWLTRKQNHVVVQIYDFDGSSWREKRQTSRTGWVGRYGPLPLFFAEDKISFYKVMSDDKGYKHIHLVKDGKATAITSGKWEVIYICKLTKDAIYFVSNQHQGVPLIIIKFTSECLTCDLNEDRCQHNSAYFSFDKLLFCLKLIVIYFFIFDSELSILEDNTDLKNLLSGFHMPTMKYGTLKVSGFDLWYQMMLPPGFKKSKKYPLLIDVYGGPSSQSVSYNFKLNWGSYLSSSHGIIVASFDGRGSGYQGDEIMHAIYRRLGTYEVEDQIAAVRKFIDMGFIDTKRIAIWGWSYGGYVASLALGAGTGLFKCGIAVAPVANWQYYDAVYTERYMGKPVENPDNYKNSTVTSRAKNFTKVDFLLVHGTADDNVHFQQAAQISNALVDEQVDFEAMWYTDRDHSLSGSARYHAFNHMSHFLQKCLVNVK
uniref:Fibroblast activation protein, alpha n=1 Tax=Oryzias sinensis TaxID=183150 RepID=A0A8C7Z9N2_9TELE